MTAKDQFGTNFIGCWPCLRGACFIEVQLHEKSFVGNVKWPFKIDARLIQVAASTGRTVIGHAFLFLGTFL